MGFALTLPDVAIYLSMPNYLTSISSIPKCGEELIFDEFEEFLSKIINYRFSKIKGMGINRNFIVSAAMCGLLGAYRRFKPGGGARFTTYAHTRVHGFISDELRKNSQVQVGKVPRNKKTTAEKLYHMEDFVTSDEKMSLIDILGVEDAVPMETRERTRLIKEGMQTLTKGQKKAIELVYFKGMKFYEAAEALGCTQSNVSASVIKGRKKLKEFLSERGVWGSAKY